MAQFLRRGRLEVETDLLLGADDVLLPAGLACTCAGTQEHAVPAESTVPAPRSDASVQPSHRGFDAELFASAPRAGAGGSRSGSESPAKVQSVVTAGGASASAGRGISAAQGTDAPQPRTEAAERIADRIVPPTGPSKAARLAELERRHAADCPHCTTATGHTSLVFGEGNPDAELVFVGEAPGETEDRTGRPFVGPAGEKLDEMIAAMGLRREDVYIANVLKSRPPANRTPLASEVDRCGPYLLAQLAVIRPKAIVTLGGPATKLLLASELGITRLRGIPARVRIGEAEGSPLEVPVMPTFHPAYLLRNYTVETRGQVWSDLKQALAMIGREPPKRG